MSKSTVIEWVSGLAMLRASMSFVGRDWKWKSVEEFVLREGRHFTQLASLQPDRREPKQCFKNALELSLEGGGRLFYCEGWALSNVPLEHAWCCDADGLIYDPTWDKADPADYLGIALTPITALGLVVEQNHYGVLFTGEGRGNDSLLRGEVDVVGKEDERWKDKLQHA